MAVQHRRRFSSLEVLGAASLLAVACGARVGDDKSGGATGGQGGSVTGAAGAGMAGQAGGSDSTPCHPDACPYSSCGPGHIVVRDPNACCSVCKPLPCAKILRARPVRARRAHRPLAWSVLSQLRPRGDRRLLARPKSLQQAEDTARRQVQVGRLRDRHRLHAGLRRQPLRFQLRHALPLAGGRERSANTEDERRQQLPELPRDRRAALRASVRALRQRPMLARRPGAGRQRPSLNGYRLESMRPAWPKSRAGGLEGSYWLTEVLPVSIDLLYVEAFTSRRWLWDQECFAKNAKLPPAKGRSSWTRHAVQHFTREAP